MLECESETNEFENWIRGVEGHSNELEWYFTVDGSADEALAPMYMHSKMLKEEKAEMEQEKLKEMEIENQGIKVEEKVKEVVIKVVADVMIADIQVIKVEKDDVVADYQVVEIKENVIDLNGETDVAANSKQLLTNSLTE